MTRENVLPDVAPSDVAASPEIFLSLPSHLMVIIMITMIMMMTMIMMIMMITMITMIMRSVGSMITMKKWRERLKGENDIVHRGTPGRLLDLNFLIKVVFYLFFLIKIVHIPVTLNFQSKLPFDFVHMYAHTSPKNSLSLALLSMEIACWRNTD